MALINTPQQEIVINTSTPHLAAIWGRKTGKTTTILMHSTMAALENPNLDIQIIPAIAYKHYMPSLLELINQMETKGIPVKHFIKNIYKTGIMRGINLHNGSRIRINRDLCGRQPDIVYLDDADNLKDEIITGVNVLMTAYDASVFAFGTPNRHKKVHFWEALHYKPSWERYYLHCTSYEAPRTNSDYVSSWLEEYKTNSPEEFEYEIMAMKSTICPEETIDKDIV
jgi:hypothetical protein